MGRDFNRTVVTMVGDPESVLQTVTECTSIALELIDMSHHSGEHARMGAVDVVPFIPIKGVTMEECIELSIRYAKSVSDAHSLPVFLYANSAQYPSRSVYQIYVKENMKDYRKNTISRLEARFWTS